MPKSKNRKNHKKKVNSYKQRVKVANQMAREKLVEEWNNKFQSSQNSKRQQTGELITDSDIDVAVDVDVDTDIDIDIDQDIDMDNVEITDEEENTSNNTKEE